MNTPKPTRRRETGTLRARLAPCERTPGPIRCPPEAHFVSIGGRR
jgi:hypothetical protein